MVVCGIRNQGCTVSRFVEVQALLYSGFISDI